MHVRPLTANQLAFLRSGEFAPLEDDLESYHANGDLEGLLPSKEFLDKVKV